MKILIIANGYPDRQSPQWGCFEKDQALALKTIGHDVTMMYVDRRFRTFWRKIGITKRKTEQGIFVYGMFYLPLGWLCNKLSYKIHQKIVMWLFDKLYQVYVKERGKPDIIYAHYIWNISFASVLKRKYGIPLVGLEHWSGLNKDELTSVARYWGNMAYSNVDKLIAVANPLRERILSHFKIDSVVIHNMIGEEFLNIPIHEKKESGKISFISVGSLLPVKGYDILINAMSLATKELPSWSLIIIGEGPEHDRLQQLINNKGLSGQITLVGRKTKPEIIQYLNASSLYISSSRSENFSVSVLEALAVGLPVIATLCGGIKECINDSNGVLVPVENVLELSQALVIISSGLAKYDNKQISEDCLHRFAPHVIARQLTVVFEEVINHRQ